MPKTLDIKVDSAPIFIDPKLLPVEALTDPNYRLNLLQHQYGNTYPITCSKCHHCR